ncbi:MAG TPA: hypothetical protein VFW87_16480, partial [Pirellulales bacterium]|nr:hypothetical protein [Pirellulales bacterium]
VVSELAAQLGLGFVQRELTVDDVSQADEALLSGTPYCLLPVTRMNRTPIGNGCPGVIFPRLVNAWSGAVGIDIARQMTGNH